MERRLYIADFVLVHCSGRGVEEIKKWLIFGASIDEVDVLIFRISSGLDLSVMAAEIAIIHFQCGCRHITCALTFGWMAIFKDFNAG